MVKRDYKKALFVVLGIIILLLILSSIFSISINSKTIKNLETLDSSREENTMRFATYNMMFGMYGRSGISSLLGHFVFHGIHSPILTGFFSKYNEQDVEFVGKANADVISLNEVLGTLKKDEIVEELRKKGFKYFSWGGAGHYDPPLDIGTLIASKYKFEELNFSLPMSDHFGGGGGGVAIFMPQKNITVIAVHLSLDKEVSLKQIEVISKFVKNQKNKKRRIILMGDFNREEQELDSNSEFDELNLIGANNKNTSPDIDLLKQFMFESVDNIYYDSSFRLKSSDVVDGYSDHRLVWADLILK